MFHSTGENSISFSTIMLESVFYSDLDIFAETIVTPLWLIFRFSNWQELRNREKFS